MNIKKKLKISPLTKGFYNLIRDQVHKFSPQKGVLKSALDKLHESKNTIHFLQIGSNDGVTSDPLFPYIKQGNWKGILVEPVPEIFSQLVSNYSSYSDDLIFENVAIGDRDSVQKFYKVSDSFISDKPWINQLGSFNKEVILRHRKKIKGIEKHIKVIDVQSMTFSSLYARHKNLMENIDVVHIDAEGYDYKILSQMDLKKMRPSIIIYEHIHLNKWVLRKLNKRLIGYSYDLYWDDKDTFCVRKK